MILTDIRSAAIKALDSNELKIAITVAVLLIAWFLFQFTRIGNDVKAVGSGETAARFSGVRTDLVKFLVFVCAGALTGLAAFVNVIKVGSITSTAGNDLKILQSDENANSEKRTSFKDSVALSNACVSFLLRHSAEGAGFRSISCIWAAFFPMRSWGC